MVSLQPAEYTGMKPESIPSFYIKTQVTDDEGTLY